MRKNGFEHVVLGLSGGIDSALVALVAADALGPEAVTCVVMPSPYSSAETQEDARTLARTSGPGCWSCRSRPDARLRRAARAGVEDRDADLTEENLQARIRGNLLMALSNKFGWLVLTTGNKSELSVGYSTLYGDTAGGFAVLKDCPKTLVYRLVEAGQRVTRPVAGPARASSCGRPRPSCVPTSATRIHCRPTRSSTRSCSDTSRRTWAAIS